MSEKKETGLHLRTEQCLPLPLRDGPVRFAVISQDGLSSNAWRVWAERTGDAYIVCRDNMKEIHVSLHQSGQQHITFEVRTADGVIKERWAQWWEPAHYGDPDIVPSFQLLFPTWALVLPYVTRLKNPQVWDKNLVLVETNEEHPLTVVSFYITNQNVSITFGGNPPSYPLAVLSLCRRPGKRLWVVASQEPEGKLREVLKTAEQRINQQGLRGERIEELDDGQELSGLPTGPTDYGCQYGIVVPMTQHKGAGDMDRSK